MPLVGMVTGGVNFNDMFVNLSDEKASSLAEATEKGIAVFAYGAFIQSIIDFLIIAICIFLMIKAMNKLKKKRAAELEATPEPSAEEKLLIEIRDIIKNK